MLIIFLLIGTMLQDIFSDNKVEEVLECNELGRVVKNLKGTLICLQNIRSANRNLDTLLLTFESIGIDCDIISFSETWGKCGNIGKISGYDVFESKSLDNRASGSALLTKENLRAIVIIPGIAPPEMVDVCIVSLERLNTSPTGS